MQEGNATALEEAAVTADYFKFEPVLETGALEAVVSPELTRFCSGCR